MSKHTHYDRKNWQTLIFLLIWPGANLLISTTVLFVMDALQWQVILTAATKLWLAFSLTFILITRLEAWYPALPTSALWRQLSVHLLVILALFSLFSPVVPEPENVQWQRVSVLPFILLALQIAVYVAVMSVFQQQQDSFDTRLHLQEAELNVLRAQGNPHFLFNTLNLIVAEISEDPDNAREIVFDLSDLLRSTTALTHQKFTTVKDELKLVSLYLTLQQKRFKDRLTFDLDVSPDTTSLQIPALLMQPIIENTVKHAVAPYAKPAHIAVMVGLSNGQLRVEVKDTGPAFKADEIEEATGFHIVRKTLGLHYPHQHHVSLISTPQGGYLEMLIPARVPPQTREALLT